MRWGYNPVDEGWAYQKNEEDKENVDDEVGRTEGLICSLKWRVIEVAENESEQSKNGSDEGAVILKLKLHRMKLDLYF